MPLRSTPLLGFKPPYVKAGEIVVPVLTGTGEWAELTATPATWQRLGLALAEHWTPKAALKPVVNVVNAAPRCPITESQAKACEASVRAVITKPGGKIL